MDDNIVEVIMVAIYGMNDMLHVLYYNNFFFLTW